MRVHGQGVFEVGVVEDDGGRFAADCPKASVSVTRGSMNVKLTLKCNALQVGVRGGLLDLAARGNASGEADLANLHVRCKKRSRGAATRHDLEGVNGADGDEGMDTHVDNTGWETRFLDELTQRDGTEGRLLRSLEDEGVARSDGGSNLLAGGDVGTVPGGCFQNQCCG